MAAVRARGRELAKTLLARGGASPACLNGSRGMAGGHALDPAQTPLQQQV